MVSYVNNFCEISITIKLFAYFNFCLDIFWITFKLIFSSLLSIHFEMAINLVDVPELGLQIQMSSLNT